MEQLQDALTTLRERWLLVLITVLVAVVAVIALSLLSGPQYRTSARFLITPAPLADPGDVVDSTATLDRPTVAATYAEIFNSPTLQQQAGQVVRVEDLEPYTFSAVVLPETSVVQVTVSGPDPDIAAQLANTLGNEVLGYLQSLTSIYELHLLDAAPVVTEPYAPQLLTNIVLALVLGLALGAVVALGAAQLSQLVALPPRDEETKRQQATRYDPNQARETGASGTSP
jgi:capsular polysaccharide biosynthesis protein